MKLYIRNMLFTVAMVFVFYFLNIFQFSSIYVGIVMCSILFIKFVFMEADCDMILHFYEYFGSSLEALNGKVIWITGASTGIGKALALALAKGNVKLVLSARSKEKLQEVKRRCLDFGKLGSRDILVLPFDMTDYAKHQEAFSSVIDLYGQVDVLVSNAGRYQRGQWEKTDTTVDKVVFELNDFSLVNLARIVTKHFLNVGRGQHVVMGSIVCKVGAPLSGPYAASKHALMGYFESLRAEKGSKGISVTILCPGPVESSILEGTVGENLSQEPDRTRVSVPMSAERCADLCVTAMANKLSEAWLCRHPFLWLMYLNQYQPALLKWIQNTVDFTALITRLRSGKNTSAEGTTSVE